MKKKRDTRVVTGEVRLVYPNLWEPKAFRTGNTPKYTCMLLIPKSDTKTVADINNVRPKIGINRFGLPCVTYEGIGATKKWERIESYGPKFVENITQAIARDILCYAMQTLRRCDIVAHVHDELIIEADIDASVEAVCEQMSRTPPWAPGLVLRADGYETPYYKKD